MKYFIAFLTAATFVQTLPATATMLTGGIKYRDVEGRIGVRVNHSGRVFKVHPDSPAEQVGIAKGDVITSVDGNRHKVTGHIHGRPGTFANLTVRRNGEERTVQVQRVEFFNIHIADKAPLLVQN